jgi:ankyrin repeat protein
MTGVGGKIAGILVLLPVLLALRPVDNDLFVATFLGDQAKVEALLQNGADVQAEQEDRTTPLRLAITRNRPEVVALLLDHGAAVDQLRIGMPPLHLAAESGFVKVMAILLDKGAAVNQVDSMYGVIPLHVASSRGHREAVALLLSKGAAVNQPAPSGMTPLHLAVRGGHRQVIDELHKYGADKTATTLKGKRPVDIARAEHDLDLIPLLEP